VRKENAIQMTMNDSSPIRARRAAVVALAMSVCLFLVVLLAPTANAAFGVTGFSGEVVDENGDPFTQAGGHPFAATATIEFNSHPKPVVPGFPFFVDYPDEDVRNVQVDLPSGFVGDPGAVPRCEQEDFRRASFIGSGQGSCPDMTQVGVVRIASPAFFGQPENTNTLPVYNLVPPPGQPALFGFRAVDVDVLLKAHVRPGDHGLTVDVTNISQALAATKTSLTFWGVPADEAHDAQRGPQVSVAFGPRPCLDGSDAPCEIDLPHKAFLTNPMDCSAGPLTTRLRVTSWTGATDTASFDHDVDGVPMAVDGCDRPRFEPTLDVRPTSRVADAPTGLEAELSLPQSRNPDAIGQAHLKRAVVTLPEGMAVSPSAAHGLQACSQEQVGLDDLNPAACPDASKIGTAEVETPLLEDPMRGEIYLARQGDNPFGTLLAMYMVIEGPGVIVKLPGKVVADPDTGRLTTTFDDNPQLPFTSFRLSFHGGPNAPLVNPPTCGTKVVESALSPWTATDPDAPTADEIVSTSNSFSIDCPGSSGFSPKLIAGTTDPLGGAFSPFVLRVERPDRQEVIDRLTAQLPTGLLAKLKGVVLCSDAQAAAGACSATSRIGSVMAGVGPGPMPFFLAQPGAVYLTGPYAGGPYGLAVVVRAVAGPFDLGTVVLRQSIHVDPRDAHLNVVAREAFQITPGGQRIKLPDAIPTILEGIPLRLRTAHVDVDRPGFVVNPTSCATKRIGVTLGSQQGSTVGAAARFRASDCALLALRPRLAMRLTGPRQRRTGGHPGIRATLRQGPGQAGIASARVGLPRSLALDPGNAQGLCSYEEGLKVNGGPVGCPSSSIIGNAVAHTPLLNQPLRGPVYFVEHKRRNSQGRLVSTLPSLLVALRGEVAIDLRAQSAVENGRLVSTFPTVPDAPVSRFDLRLKGGKGGIIVVTRTAQRRFDVCRGRHVAQVEIDGHNGRRADFGVAVRKPCKPRASRATDRRHR
jgi:hypothetical protein